MQHFTLHTALQDIVTIVATTESWHVAARCKDVRPNDAIAVTVGSHHIALYHVDGRYYATAGHCTHARTPLVDGYLEGEIIECPLHQGRFNISTGKALCSPATVDLKTYPVRIENEEILVCIS